MTAAKRIQQIHSLQRRIANRTLTHKARAELQGRLKWEVVAQLKYENRLDDRAQRSAA